MRPLMGADPEPHEEPVAPRVELVRYADALDRIDPFDRRVCHGTHWFDRLLMGRNHERPYRRILTSERTSRALLPTPVA
ncbi:hypothetical protein [Nocardia anaemiae]|uniref:hypothetical protein n=1 Tax=Nocardia anaemiae TaxID=263910 RepID=UPI0012F48AEC|nr:hypothetical protein [Nocardia anaemiae]